MLGTLLATAARSGADVEMLPLRKMDVRTCPVWPRLEGKKVAGLAVAEESTGQAINNFKTYASLCKMRWAGSVTTLAKDPGDAARNKNLKRRLTRLAQKLMVL
jgi:hypothetical protein